MKRVFPHVLALCCAALPLAMYGQASRPMPGLRALGTETAPGWFVPAPDRVLDAKSFPEQHAAALGLLPGEQLALLKTETDALGWVHQRYQLTVQGVPVEGAQWLTHAENGILRSANGYLPYVPGPHRLPQLAAAQAVAKALQQVNADRYMWEDAGATAMLRRLTGNPQASYYPEAQLVYTDADFERNETAFALAWKVEVYAASPHSKQLLYFDAQTGALLKSLETLHTANSTGVAETKYSGTRTIVTDSTASGFRLREQNRGLGVSIETYDLNQGTDFDLAEDFWDADNYWNNVNPELDEAATDAHWGAEVTYDYFLQTHNRNSYDNAGSPVVSYIHYDVAFFNAFWNGQWMTFGDGNNSPLTGLDVVAHELTHGVTQYSADLVYAYEPGALNESFSDIFGNLAEHAGDAALADWRIGEGFGFAFRSMSNPKQFGNPDTYKGNNWLAGTFDNGGVHINSGVQNYWFYLLSEGGSGTNDRNVPYAVTGIGREAAGQIAYRNLVYYLTPLSQYADARMGSIRAAEDLFGTCSPAYQSVFAAWHAVGIGTAIRSLDFGVVHVEPFESCEIGAAEQVTITVQYFGCDTLPPQLLQVAYFAEPFALSVEPLQLGVTLPGSSFTYTFQQPLDMSANGTYSVVSRTLSATDPDFTNDSSAFVFAYRTALPEADTLTFEQTASLGAQLHLREGSEGNIETASGLGAGGSTGLLMEGGDRDAFGIFWGFLDPFEGNPDYTSQACFCASGSALDSMHLSFDLRQTFSPFREINLGIDSLLAASWVNNFRVTVNGREAQRFTPYAHNPPQFTPQRVDLTPFLAETMRICLESNLNQSRAGDGFEIGDAVYLDNIRIETDAWATAADPDALAGVQLFPNPAGSLLTIRSTAAPVLEVQVRNLMGQTLMAWQRQGGTEAVLDLAALPAGLYVAEIRTQAGRVQRQFVRE